MAKAKKTVARKTVSKVSSTTLELMKKQKAGEISTKPVSTGKQPHGIIDAKAGTGKTTTLIGGLKVMRGWNPGFKGTEQQQAIWDFMAMRPQPVSVKMVAFNVSIAKVLQERVPQGVDASTMHSMGYAAVKKFFRIGGKYAVQKNKTQYMLEEIIGKDKNEIWKETPEIMRATPQLVKMCKMNLAGTVSVYSNGSSVREFRTELIGDKELLDLCMKYEIECGGYMEEVFEYTRSILDRCYRLDEQDRKIVDFDDQVWLPVVRNLPVWKVELLLVDEAQDLNPVQQQLALMSGERLILCGDPRQAIYGFAGADTDSMPNMRMTLEKTERGCEVFPLNETFRCGKKIVALANTIVPDFYAYKGNQDGAVEEIPGDKLLDMAEVGDMIVCRTNAPLVSPAYKLIARGKKAQIVGGKLGDQLLDFVKKMNATDVTDLMDKTQAWYDTEVKKFAKSKREDKEAILMSLADKKECVFAFCENCLTVEDVVKGITKMFVEDNTDGIRLSSVHKAKGLEADRVFILCPEKMPHPMAKTAWAKTQEMNLKYVAITRAKNLLAWVTSL